MGKLLRAVKVMNANNNYDTLARMVAASVDGELSLADEKALRKQMAENAELETLEAALLEMRELVQMDVEVAADAVNFSAMWEGIEAQLTTEQVAVEGLQLQALADGELSSAESTVVSQAVAASEGDRERLAAIEEMGDLLRMAAKSAADQADFGQLWARLDAEVGDHIEARGGFNQSTSEPAVAQPSWFKRLLSAIGGARAVGLAVATAALALAIAIPAVSTNDTLPGNDGAANAPQAVDIHVHVNEIRSDPGYNVTVDSPDDPGVAPVIYIRPDSTVQNPGDGEEDAGGQDGLFDNPI